MDNQHRKIKGYRELSQETIDLMNQIKEVGVVLEALVEVLENHPDTDKRMVAIGVTQMQLGGMALTRSVAKPGFFF